MRPSQPKQIRPSKRRRPRPSRRPSRPTSQSLSTPGLRRRRDPITPPAKAVKESPRRTGQIAVFISGKDSKLYVRQNFAPLFDVPVTIASSNRPLGTHVFTVQVDKADTNALHWSVVTVPIAHSAARKGVSASLHAASARVHRPRPRSRSSRSCPTALPGAGSDHRPAGGDGAHRRGADHRRLDHRGGPEHQAGRDRRRTDFILSLR